MPFAVTARDAEQAIERAIKENEIPECERWRISVRARRKARGVVVADKAHLAVAEQLLKEPSRRIGH